MAILDFLQAVDNLKWVLRVGWLLRGIPSATAENVAAHSHSVTVIAYLLAKLDGNKVDFEKVFLMSLFHDLPESRLGDIPRDPTEELQEFYDVKSRAENQVMVSLIDELPQKLRAPLLETWDEYQNQSSREALIVEAADRFANALHALQLVQAGRSPKSLFVDFINPAERAVGALKIPAADKLMKDLRRALGL
jgi:putative hydrolase of HD superfamily